MTHHHPALADAVARLTGGASRVVDATVGLGGHTARFRTAGALVLAVDRDPQALAAARAALGDERIRWHLGRFADPAVVAAVAAFRPDVALFDLGVSSPHLDQDARGFSFRPGVALDMRMGEAGPTAADLLNTLPAEGLTQMFRDYGDERRARRLAAVVRRRRARRPFATSDDLVGAIREALGPRTGPSHFARLFQAVRIAVNDELVELERALPAYRDALVPGGRLLAITYHSGEDRIVKHRFREWAQACVCPPGLPICTCRGRPLGRLDPRAPIRPGADEIGTNPRARSATLRGFRTDAPA